MPKIIVSYGMNGRVIMSQLKCVVVIKLTYDLILLVKDSNIKIHEIIRPVNGTRFIPDICVVPCKILTWLSHGAHKILT